MQLDSFSQLNLMDLHIVGPTRSLLSTLADAVLFWTVGAAWMRAASAVTRVFLQSEKNTCVGLQRSMRCPGLQSCLRTAPRTFRFPVTCVPILISGVLPVSPTYTSGQEEQLMT